MNNDRNAIPKPMHVQVQDLTAALDKALKDVKIRDEALLDADNKIDFLRDNVEHLRLRHDEAYRIRDMLWKDRDKVINDFIGLNKRLNLLEHRLGMEDRPVPFRIPQDDAPEQDPFADVPPAPQRIRPVLPAPQRLNRQNMPRGQLAEQAIQAGVDRMQQVNVMMEMERLAQAVRQAEVEQLNPWAARDRAQRPINQAQWADLNVAVVGQIDFEQAPEVGAAEFDDNF